ncbi:MAG: hypothetical protein DRI56_02680 [Chloroflexota bacterium]|nr:MAG: hypothetical protein DRI56_02680 [Chloroflexota bacterium]
MSRSSFWQLFLFFLFLTLILGSFVWFLFLRRERITHLQLDTPTREKQTQFDKFDLGREELEPKQNSKQLQAKHDASLYTALKTVRGQLLTYDSQARTLTLQPQKNKALGDEPLEVSLAQLETITCWPEYYQADDGSKVALSEAYISVHPEKEEFFWADQKTWPYAFTAIVKL